MIHGTYIPEGFDHGFLDVDYFDGESFAPHGNGKVDVIKQTFRPWNTNDIYVRTYNAHLNRWTGWKEFVSELYTGDIHIEGKYPVFDEKGNDVSPYVGIHINTVSHKPLDDIASITDLNRFMGRRALYVVANGYIGDFRVMGLYYDDESYTTRINYYDTNNHISNSMDINKLSNVIINFTQFNYYGGA